MSGSAWQFLLSDVWRPAGGDRRSRILQHLQLGDPRRVWISIRRSIAPPTGRCHVRHESLVDLSAGLCHSRLLPVLPILRGGNLRADHLGVSGLENWKKSGSSLSVDTITEHFFAPRNVGDAHEPSFVGRASSLRCGATSRFSIQVGEANQITEARFKAAGCNVLIATLSKLSELVKDKTTAEAASLGQDLTLLLDCFDFIEPDRMSCTEVAREALLNAVRAYSDAARDEWNGDDALICTCFCISEQTVEETIHEHGLTTVAEVTRTCYAGGGCGSCHQLIREMLETV